MFLESLVIMLRKEQLIMSPKWSLGDVLCLLHFFLLLFFFFFLSSAKSFSDTFLGDALIKLYETL